ncbi:hypothetical protein MSAR_01260 [Mycolicibacterium sarraceniae]|uniref:Uncharacterized protein n=1 Tax=Mycolicibacterium sarraceniae TaxID=1534348 RepID=A0A7I7SKD2_9MYCO|nr:hypothetical protein MSAR_01260 [Mycolicibacterium sarraceniae]
MPPGVARPPKGYRPNPADAGLRRCRCCGRLRCASSATGSGDAGRIEDLIQSFCPDGELEVRGAATAAGRAAIAEFLGRVAAPLAQSGVSSGIERVVRHTLTNVRFTELTAERAQVS